MMVISELILPFPRNPYENNTIFIDSEIIMPPQQNFILGFAYVLYILFIFLLLFFYQARNGFFNRTNINEAVRLSRV
ncbi:unnamed protein product [Meloidogyne enterolobii]|uniref:Uncharacterized protein n=1 Tax=Meloidogyne enterolobii TaxID=390850 RepID=A0ACB0YCA7_MELEN